MAVAALYVKARSLMVAWTFCQCKALTDMELFIYTEKGQQKLVEGHKAARKNRWSNRQKDDKQNPLPV